MGKSGDKKRNRRYWRKLGISQRGCKTAERLARQGAYDCQPPPRWSKRAWRRALLILKRLSAHRQARKQRRWARWREQVAKP